VWGYYPPLWYPGIGVGLAWYPGIDLGLHFGGWGGWAWGSWSWAPNWFVGNIYIDHSFISTILLYRPFFPSSLWFPGRGRRATGQYSVGAQSGAQIRRSLRQSRSSRPFLHMVLLSPAGLRVFDRER